VANYLSGHQDRMMYAARLRRGVSIGSGMIEGAIKQLVVRRIKQTGARWKTDHVSPDYSHPCTQLWFEYIWSGAIMTGPGGARTGPYPCCEVQQVFLSP
jgi:hypothetical protein